MIHNVFSVSVGYDDDNNNEIKWCNIDYDNVTATELDILERAIKFWKDNNEVEE